MATINRFEDLNVWRESRIQAQTIYLQIISNDVIKDYPIKDQMNRSSASVMDNIAEGFDRKGNKEFKHFLTISLGSNSELKSQIYRAFDRSYIDQSSFDQLILRNENISKMITGFMKYLSKTELKGTKFLIEEPEMDY
uniref:four helix bundle protein n=1 Tax=Roseivirga sp. TaxID=1964215 RepID=UPI004048A7E5